MQSLNLARLTKLIGAITIAVLAVAAHPQSYPPAWSSASSYAVGDQVQLKGNVLRATHAVVPGGFKYDDWEMWEVRANTIVFVGAGQSFSTLPTAWSWVQNARVASGAYLHIYISTAHGNYNETLSSPFSLDHQSGSQISLIGDNQANINFSSSGFVIDSGHTFASLSGVTVGVSGGSGLNAVSGGAIEDVSNTTISNTANPGFGTGVAVTQGAMHLETSVTITGFATAISADLGGSVVLASHFPLNGAGPASFTTGLYANRNGVISAQYCDLGNATNGFETGAQAENGGLIDLTSAQTYNCGIAVQADAGGRIYAFGINPVSNNLDVKVYDGGTVFDTSPGTLNTSTGTGDGSYIWRS